MVERTETIQRTVRIMVILTSLFGAAWLLHAGYQWHTRQPMIKLNMDMDSLFQAFREYRKVVGHYPAGSNAEITQALYGKNEKNLMILIVPKCDINEKGEVVDPWGTALRFYFGADDVTIRSAGPNRLLEDSKGRGSDDYWRSD